MTSGVRGALELGSRNVLLPRASLTVSAARELLVVRSIPAAYRTNGTVAADTGRTTLLSRDATHRPPPTPKTLGDETVVEVVDDEAVWGGYGGLQYGHFLVESVTRLWPLLPGGGLEGRPVVFTPPRDPPYVVEWLEAFGARTVELPRRGAVRFTRMRVPEPAWQIGGWIAPEIRDIHLHARAGLNVPPTLGNDVLWLSRSGLKRNRVPYDEALLEWLLGEHVTVVTPETMPLGEQVAILEGSRAAVGVVGSAFHTLLMAAETPDCLYLCPPWDKGGGVFPAQHRLLDSQASFVQALSVAAWTPRARRRGIVFPEGYRISIPRALRAMQATVLPALFDDPRMEAFAFPESQPGGGGTHSGEDAVDALVRRVLLDPLSVEARMELGAAFEASGLDRCGLEQFAVAADLSDVPAEGALHAARLLARSGRPVEASAMAGRAIGT